MTTNAANRVLLRTLQGDIPVRPPVWLMRQAGRYLPEYRKTREKAGSFLDLCYNTELATEVTLQPIRRFGFDAAILFADILLIPHALGRRLWFEEGEGPRLDALTDMAAVRGLASDEFMHEKLYPVYETVRHVRRLLSEETTLIGFAGAPWTVATYMVAGRGKDNQLAAMILMREKPDVFTSLMQRLESATLAYLERQIQAGADVVMIFDSWAGALASDRTGFERWCIEPIRRIVQDLRSRHRSVPCIVFPRGAGQLYASVASAVGPDAISFDEAMDPVWVKNAMLPLCGVQGNLHPKYLVAGGSELDSEVRRLLELFSGTRYIFNLGHGITPDAEIRNVARLVELVRT